MKVSARTRALSHLAPQRLWKGESAVSGELELLLYQGRYQLATADALYSDGDRYRPLVAAFRPMKARLQRVCTALVLGGGLGSAVDVLARYGARPEITMVELDEVVAGLGENLLSFEAKERVRYVVADAQTFIQNATQRYDLLIVDVFTARQPLPFVSEDAFLEKCRAAISPGGCFVLNYMQNPGAAEAWDTVESRIQQRFPAARTMAIGPNRVVVWVDDAVT